MTNFKQRTLTGTALIIMVLLAVWLGAFTLTAMLLLVNLFGLQEFYRLLENSGTKPYKTAGYILSTSLVLTCLAALTGLGSCKLLLINLPIAFGIFVTAIYLPVKNPFGSLAITFLGIICITLPLCLFLTGCFLSPFGHYQLAIPLGSFLLIWTHDTGAYLVGRRFGKHQLFRRLSPKKTWEGSFGGAAATLVMGGILSRYLTLLSVLDWEIISLLIIFGGTYGDLVKSMLKRSVGAKDSGTMLPGHGGMLDRFDSLLGSAPFIFIYLLLLSK